MLPRGVMSFKDRENKKYFLRVAWILPSSRALPQMGDPVNRKESASQELMGWMLGQDRTTTNRDLRLFCGPDALIAQFFHKHRPGIGLVNHYGECLPAIKRRAGESDEDYEKRLQAREVAISKKPLCRLDPPKLADLYGAQYFDAEMADYCERYRRKEANLNGSFECELFTFAPQIKKPIRCSCRLGQMKFNFNSNCGKCGGRGFTFHPTKKLGANTRILLAVLQAKGIKLRGYLDMTCEELGELCGLTRNKVAKALDEWEDLKILQIVPGDVIYDAAGKPVFRYPQRIIWLPGVLLDHDIVQREKLRFQAHWLECQEKAKLNGWANARVHLDRIKALHTELLRRWVLSKHSLGGVWSAMRKLIYREGIPRAYREEIFPCQRTPFFRE